MADYERTKPGTLTWARMFADHMARYHFALDYARGRKVLDAGTGHGYGAAFLKLSGAASVHAIDIAADIIKDAQATYGSSGVQFFQDDCQTLAGAARHGPFEVVTNFENIEHLPEPRKYLDVVRGVIAPGGVMITSSPDRAGTPPFIDGKPQNPFHVNEWYFDEFQSLLSGYFRTIEYRLQVLSHVYAQRVQATRSLTKALALANPVSFLVNKALRKSGKGLYGPMGDLVCPVLGDYPIVTPEIASLYGTPHVIIAVCRDPK